jgi:hypothetical protein
LVGLYNGDINNDNAIRIWAGNTTIESAPFRVSQNGKMYASNAEIAGKVTATDGAIGGFIISETNICDVSGNVGLSSAGTDTASVRIWAGGTTINSAPFRILQSGKMISSNADISGKITASSGMIGPFNINNSGIYVGDIENMATSKANFVYIHSSSIKLGQQAGLWTPGDIANMKVFIGRNADPSITDVDAYCSCGLYIYRQMNADASHYYTPAARIVSDNVVNRNIAMRLEGGLQVWGGIMERGHFMLLSGSGSANVLDLSFGTTFLIKNTYQDDYWFYVPKLSQVREQLGITDNSQPFCVPIRIMVSAGSRSIVIASQKYISSVSDAEGGTFRLSDSFQEWNSSRVTMAIGDMVEFYLCYDGSEYWQLLRNHRD